MNNKLYARPELQEVRKAKGYDQKEMAEMLTVLIGANISTSLYQKWEQGALGVPPERALRVAKALDSSIGEIWSAKDNG